MAIALALYQPDIPQNTGTLMRLCACMDVTLHIIHPTGFVFSDKNLRRAGMDYAQTTDIIKHNNFSAFQDWRIAQDRRLVLLTTKATQSAYDFAFESNDILLLGRESAGVPDDVAITADAPLRIPMANNMRSLNVAISGAMILGEALRQTDGLRG